MKGASRKRAGKRDKEDCRKNRRENEGGERVGWGGSRGRKRRKKDSG